MSNDPKNVPAWQGKGVNGKKVTAFVNDDQTRVQISSPSHLTEIEFRNVGNRNPDGMIQFTVAECKRKTGKVKLICFSIPEGLAPLFISKVSTPTLIKQQL